MTDAFIAIVQSGSIVTGYIVLPQIIEHDGLPHPPIKVGTMGGITPNPGDYVLVVTSRNNLDNLPVQRYYGATEACGRIVAVVVTSSQYVLTGSYKFIGSVSVQGNLDVTGNVSITGNCTITGSLTVGGKPYLLHTHSGVTTGGGVSGPVVP